VYCGFGVVGASVILGWGFDGIPGGEFGCVGCSGCRDWSVCVTGCLVPVHANECTEFCWQFLGTPKARRWVAWDVGTCGRLLEIVTVGDRMEGVVGVQPNLTRQSILYVEEGEGFSGLLGSRA
jgi:hypothetical protein